MLQVKSLLELVLLRLLMEQVAMVADVNTDDLQSN